MTNMRRWRYNKNRVVICETAETHKKMNEFIKTEIDKKTWPYKVIGGEAEAERVVHREKQFLIVPDVEEFTHMLVLFTERRLQSIRNLRGRDLPLLRQVAVMVREKLGSDKMVYFHYPPSVWQLHLHVTSASDGLRTTNDMQKVHFLDDVIRNIELKTDYYAHATLTYVLPFYHDLCSNVCKEIFYNTDSVITRTSK